jgi:hypothetical protein
MADLVKARLVRGKHQVIDSDGSRRVVMPGQVVMLTLEQAEAFKDKFELVKASAPPEAQVQAAETKK